MASRSRSNRGVTASELIYLAPFVIGVSRLHLVEWDLEVLVALAVGVSWYQDWLSAQAANTYFGRHLVTYDLLTAGNYVGVAVAIGLDSDSPLPISAWLVFHWALIFLIYIIWNLRLARDGEPRTRRFMIGFSIVELPFLAALCLLVMATVTNRAWLSGAIADIIIAIVACGHLAMVAGWRILGSAE